MCFALQRHTIFGHPNFKKCSETVCFFNILTCKCAWRYSGVQFFDIRTSKTASDLRCFVHFDLQMCFALQRRAIFRHQNVKNCFGPAVFCTFWLQDVLLAKAACNFSTSKLQKVFRTCGLLCIFTSKRAIRHSGAQFWSCPRTTRLRTRRINKPTFRRTRHTNHCKNAAFRDFSNICRGCLFYLLTFALLSSFCWLDYCTPVLLLCFSTLHIVGSFYLNFLRPLVHFTTLDLSFLWLSQDLSTHICVFRVLLVGFLLFFNLNSWLELPLAGRNGHFVVRTMAQSIV